MKSELSIKVDQKISPAIYASALALMSALVAVFTILIKIPIPATQGYFNLCDVAIFFTALTFGPFIGALAGGLGSALADLYLGYAIFAPVSFVAHGAEGLLIGLVARHFTGDSDHGLTKMAGFVTLAIAGILGTTVMAAGYFVAESFLFGAAKAVISLPVNVLQAGFGAVFGSLLHTSVKRAYPPVSHMFAYFKK